MEGCLYKYADNYYLVSGVASYFIMVKDFANFSERFIQKEEILNHYNLIDFNSKNVMMLLDTYEKFEDKINYANLKDFHQIIYNDRKYFIRTWNDVYDFIAVNMY